MRWIFLLKSRAALWKSSPECMNKHLSGPRQNRDKTTVSILPSFLLPLMYAYVTFSVIPENPDHKGKQPNHSTFPASPFTFFMPATDIVCESLGSFCCLYTPLSTLAWTLSRKQSSQVADAFEQTSGCICSSIKHLEKEWKAHQKQMASCEESKRWILTPAINQSSCL